MGEVGVLILKLNSMDSEKEKRLEVEDAPALLDQDLVAKKWCAHRALKINESCINRPILKHIKFTQTRKTNEEKNICCWD
jgi:hypothetical protein